MARQTTYQNPQRGSGPGVQDIEALSRIRHLGMPMGVIVWDSVADEMGLLAPRRPMMFSTGGEDIVAVWLKQKDHSVEATYRGSAANFTMGPLATRTDLMLMLMGLRNLEGLTAAALAQLDAWGFYDMNYDGDDSVAFAGRYGCTHGMAFQMSGHGEDLCVATHLTGKHVQPCLNSVYSANPNNNDVNGSGVALSIISADTMARSNAQFTTFSLPTGSSGADRRMWDFQVRLQVAAGNIAIRHKGSSVAGTGSDDYFLVRDSSQDVATNIDDGVCPFIAAENVTMTGSGAATTRLTGVCRIRNYNKSNTLQMRCGTTAVSADPVVSLSLVGWYD